MEEHGCALELDVGKRMKGPSCQLRSVEAAGRVVLGSGNRPGMDIWRGPTCIWEKT